MHTFPRLRTVLTKLLFAPEPQPETSDADPAASGEMNGSVRAEPLRLQRSSPGERYYLLSAEDKVAILSFLCDAVVSHKEIHVFMDTCEANLTQLRKEKIEVKKERKKM